MSNLIAPPHPCGDDPRWQLLTKLLSVLRTIDQAWPEKEPCWLPGYERIFVADLDEVIYEVEEELQKLEEAPGSEGKTTIAIWLPQRPDAAERFARWVNADIADTFPAPQLTEQVEALFQADSRLWARFQAGVLLLTEEEAETIRGVPEYEMIVRLQEMDVVTGAAAINARRRVFNAPQTLDGWGFGASFGPVPDERDLSWLVGDEEHAEYLALLWAPRDEVLEWVEIDADDAHKRASAIIWRVATVHLSPGRDKDVDKPHIPHEPLFALWRDGCLPRSFANAADLQLFLKLERQDNRGLPGELEKTLHTEGLRFTDGKWFVEAGL